MPSGIQNWSKTAASNGNIDTSINFLEGQAPSTVNDSARAVMARLKEWYEDLGGITTAGTSTAYTVTTNRVFTTAALMDKAIITIIPHATSGAAPTLSVDGLTARQIRRGTGVNVPAGALVAGTPYAVIYLNASTEFILLSGTGAISAIDINGTSSILTAPDTADEAIVYDVSGAVNAKITLGNLFKVIDTFTAKTNLAAADEVAIYDVAGTAAKKATMPQLFSAINALTAKTSPVAADEIAIYDVAGTTGKKATLAQIATALPAYTAQALTSGTGATYTTPANCRLLLVKMVGASGGGGGGGNAGGTGGTGGDTSFGSTTAKGGVGGASTTSRASGASGQGGSGGTTGTGTEIKRWTGANGGHGNLGVGGDQGGVGGQGGGSPFAGAGNGGASSFGNGGAGIANTGSGGGGGGGATGFGGGGGGGAGEYVEFYITSPSATYTYTIPSGGSAGTAGGSTGGAGASGFILVEEYY